MTSSLVFQDAFHTSLHPLQRPRRRLAVVAAAVVQALIASLALAPSSQTGQFDAYVAANAQTVSVSGNVVGPAVTRESYSATAGVATLVAGGTNHDWAKLVLLFGGFPMTDANVTVLTRWMRQENGPDDWWRRNNPLNNGWGSGGGGGLGSYDSLVIAAENAAKALHGNRGYGSIIAALASSAPTEVTERAIWASPWATGHYANGGHWSYAPVPVVKAPASSW